ncbi:hypothetical protein NW768_008056 [Fusarium equiseti]|uniref:Uncharacterized protein n=1 Tax=Fusarium equiseti TaxID=61235 RepID=A0ABQ8R5P1_FUSEQ|nr:hypothetical protein NW768_008056 [Fusarium equiseti]
MYSTIYSAPPKSTGDSTATTAGTTASDAETTSTSTSDPSTGNSNSNSSPNNDSGSNELSSGAVAGIAVGATLAVVALALAGFFFWRRNKRKYSPASTEPSDEKHNNAPIVVSPGDGMGSYYSPAKQEMPHEHNVAELSNGQHQRHEMA